MKLEKIDREDAEKRVEKLIEQINILSQFNISENFPFYKSIDSLPFSLIHGDFDSQNILVEVVDDDIKFVGVIDWEFSRTGTLLNLCVYPVWIQEPIYGPYKVFSDKELQEIRENRDLRAYFRDEVIAVFGDKGGQILDMRERNSIIEDLEYTVFYTVFPFIMQEINISAFIGLYIK
jgi:aminoglycoside phosphotransferase (APT) family kinase protein